MGSASGEACFLSCSGISSFRSESRDWRNRARSACRCLVGRLPTTNVSVAIARQHLVSNASTDKPMPEYESKYAARFTEGATVVPRVLIIVERQPTPKLGAGAGRVAVRSLRGAKEKKPWKFLKPLTGTVERQFVRPLVIGETVLPYRLLEPLEAIIPWDGTRLLPGNDEHMEYYPGLASWWRQAEAAWIANRSSDRLDLLGRLDYRHGVSHQFPVGPRRVIYTKSGMYLAATYITDDRIIVDQGLYWAAAASLDEARYLVAILNSEIMTQRVRPLQARGQHNPRHFAKHIWRLPVPIYDPVNEQHYSLVALSEQSEKLVASLDLPHGLSFEALRRRVRQAVTASEAGQQIELIVSQILG